MKLEKYKQRNPKKIGIAVFTIACVLLIAFVFIYSSFASFETNETRTFINGNVVDPGDLYFAFYIDGVISNRMPQKGEGYVLDTEKTTCTNGASIDFDETDWSIKVLNMTKTRTKCTLYFKEQTFNDAILACNDTAANCIKDNASLTTELVDDETVDHNIRYIGANPNNYVSFNNELWRIIGVFNNIDNGSGTKETRIKLIRDESIGEYSWDTDNMNDWTDSTLKEVLNNGPYWNRTIGLCPSGQNQVPIPCDFSSTGLTEEAKSMIGDAVWNLGGSSTYNDVTTSMFYERERGTTVYSERPTKWIGKIGLMYASDYGYATSGGSTINRETCLNTVLYDWESDGDLQNNDCQNNDWLYKFRTYQWTLTPYASTSNSAFYVYFDGNVRSNGTAAYGNAVSPALYLNSNVKISGGSGTESNPFVLSL